LSNLTNTVNANQASTNAALSNLSAQDQANYANLTAAQKQQAQDLAAQGQSLSSAIGQVAQQSQTGLSNLSNTVNANQASTTAALTGLSAQDQANYNSLSAGQQQQAQALAAQGTSLSAAIAAVGAAGAAGLSNLASTVASNQAATTSALGTVNSGLSQLQNANKVSQAQQALDNTKLAPYKAQTIKGNTVNLIGENPLTATLAPLDSQSVNPYQVQYNAKEGGHIASFSEGSNDGIAADDTFNVPESAGNLIPVSHSPLIWHGNPGKTQNFTTGLASPHLGAIHIQARADGGTIHEEHHPEFYSEGGLNAVHNSNTYVTGKGDGTSDSIPAMLANGEFVIPADVVSSLGNGDNTSGASVLDQFLQVIRHHKRDAAPDQLPPDSKGPLTYLAEAQHKAKKA